MLRRVVLVRTDVPEELSASFITVSTIGEIGTTLAVTSNRRTLRKKVSELTASFIRVTRIGEIGTTPFFGHYTVLLRGIKRC
jgi:hypothetical protein